MGEKLLHGKVKKMPFTLDSGTGSRARLGLLVLESDQSIEDEFRLLTQIAGDSVFHSRLVNDTFITEETLKKMEEQIPLAASLLPNYLKLKVIGYGCTSGSTIIGEKKVENIIRKIHPKILVTNPLSAAKEALKALNINRLALITPYSPNVTKSMEVKFEEAGLTVTVIGSFFQQDDKVVAKIDPESILKATIEMGSNEKCDGVFISCTNLRCSSIIEKAESILNKPVTASNHALAWHMIRLAGVDDKIDKLGELFHL